jgi:hypothetical protein
VAHALTKDAADASTVLATYIAASEKLESLPDSPTWIVVLAAKKIGDNPRIAATIVILAKQVIEYYEALQQKAVEVQAFSSLDDALASLKQLSKLDQELERLLLAEGLPEERVSIAGLSLTDAEIKLSAAMANVSKEKESLLNSAQTLKDQLRLLGVESHIVGATLSELRVGVSRLQGLLEERRRALKESLGSAVFEVVESLLQGRLPNRENVDNEALGSAIRMATDIGYRLQMEAPHEDS